MMQELTADVAKLQKV